MIVSYATRHFWFFAFHILLCLLICVALIGCSSEEKSGDDQSTSQLISPGPSQQTTSVIPDSSDSQTSPAAAISTIPSADATPDQVCQRFMQLLQNGNRSTAEKLLTRTAFTVTSQADFQIPPVGGTDATYEMKAVRYATKKQKLAQADCKINDVVEGQSEESEITWMVRRKKEGWRIFGMLVQLYDNKPKDLISFENPADVAMIKETLSGQQVQQDLDGSQKLTDPKAKANAITQNSLNPGNG